MDLKTVRPLSIILLLSMSSHPLAQSTTEKLSIAEELDQISAVSIFTATLKQSGLWAVVQNSKSIALFVPTDSALDNEMSAFLLQTVLTTPDNAGRLINSLAYHIVLGVNQAFDNAGASQQLMTLSGECLPVTTTDSDIKVGPEASVVDIIRGVNGVIYIVDHLLWSPFEGSHCQYKFVSGL